MYKLSPFSLVSQKVDVPLDEIGNTISVAFVKFISVLFFITVDFEILIAPMLPRTGGNFRQKFTKSQNYCFVLVKLKSLKIHKFIMIYNSRQFCIFLENIIRNDKVVGSIPIGSTTCK